jgi:hypothetical protein
MVLMLLAELLDEADPIFIIIDQPRIKDVD